ncbi:MAG TPA: hypothetical protein VHM01_17960, partial [Alphaproteobacteria bacterium]|nr:hypothetical protein [Alphaproteobacteria bacterium]
MAAALLFMLSLLWDGLLHVVLLADADELMPLSLLLAAALAVVFIWGCARFARDRSLREGAL